MLALRFHDSDPKLITVHSLVQQMVHSYNFKFWFFLVMAFNLLNSTCWVVDFFQGFDEYQMSRLKKSEAFTAEREREISQVKQ